MARVFLCALFAVAVYGVAGRAQAPAPRQGGPGGGQFAGQTPINAMIITGGCCHDYTGQSKVLMDTLNAVMPINWTVVQGMVALPDGRLPLFENSNWARGFTSSFTTSAGRMGTCRPASCGTSRTQPCRGCSTTARSTRIAS